jgi:hypothetical protein
VRSAKRWICALVLALSGCGVGPEAGQLAKREAAVLAQTAVDDESVRQALVFQADGWNTLALQLQHKQIGGVPIGADFVELVLEVGQLARRQRALLQANEDDPAKNREVLEEMERLWGHAAEYLAP